MAEKLKITKVEVREDERTFKTYIKVGKKKITKYHKQPSDNTLSESKYFKKILARLEEDWKSTFVAYRFPDGNVKVYLDTTFKGKPSKVFE